MIVQVTRLPILPATTPEPNRMLGRQAWGISFVKIALLRYNLRTVKFTHLKCMVKWFLAYLHSCTNITVI